MVRLWMVAVLIGGMAGCNPGGGEGGDGAADRGPDDDAGSTDARVEVDDARAPDDLGVTPLDRGPDATPLDQGADPPDADRLDQGADPPDADRLDQDPDPPDVDGAPAVDVGAPDVCADCGGAPRILTFGANTRMLTAGEEVILTAVVTDPDGAADLLGGVLEAPNGTPYGPFAAAAEAGTYSFTLSWAALNAVQAIEFDGEGRRTVVAVFFDQAGNRTTEALDLTLHCRGAGEAACDGACASLDSLDHCGACGAACDAVCRDRACVCDGGLTRCDGICIETSDDPANCGGCGRTCDAPPDGEGVCRDGQCRVVCAPGFQLCDPEAPVCAPCPIEGVARVTCDDARCVAAACAPDHLLCEGACAACPGDGDGAEGLMCLGAHCAATLCGQDTHPCTEGCCPWRSLDVAESGRSFALAVDVDGVHIALGDRERVVYRRWVDEAWLDEIPLELDAPAQSNIEVEVARVDGVTHLVYAVIFPPRGDGSVPSRIGYMQREDGAWRSITTVEGGAEIYHQPDLAVRGDVMRVAWAGRRIRVVDPREVPWAPDLAFERSESEPRLAIAPDGTVHLVATELFGDLLYARQAPGGVFETVDAGAGRLGGIDPRIGTDADGLPVILHRTEDGQLYTTRFDGRSWGTVITVPGFQALYGHDVFNGADGRIVACLGTQLGLHLMHETERNPVVREVANGEHFGCTFALAPDGGQHLLSAAGQTIYWFY